MEAGPVWFLTHEFDPFRGGAATYVRETFRAARALGMDVHLLAPSYGGCLNRDHELNDPGLVRVHRFAGRGKLGPLGIMEMAAGIWRHRLSLADAPLILGSAGALMAMIVLERAGLFRPSRLLTFLHGSEILKLRRRLFWRALAPAFFRRWPHVAAASRFVHDLWLSGAPITYEVHLAPCACAESFLSSAAVATGISSPASAVDETFTVLTVARLHPRKGQLHVARALGLLPEILRQRVRYIVVGNGADAYRRQLEDFCHASHVKLSILPGVPDEELSATYTQATVYAQASVTMPESVEGFGITYLEAAACGLPIAAWASGGTSEAVCDGQTGLLVPEGDFGGLAAAIRRLLENPELRARFSASARLHSQTFRWDNSAQTLVTAVQAAFPIA